MNTWAAEEPPVLPPATPGGRIAGGLRLGALVGVTLIAVALFLVGRAMQGLLGGRITFHFRVARLWSRFVLGLAGIGLVVRGTPVASGALVANHVSWLDIPALRTVRLIYFVSKAEVANWPGVGFITRITGTIFIERRRSQVKEQERVLRERIAAEHLLCLFPEGTSTDGQRVLPFKTSLFSTFFDDGQGTEIPIQPVTLRYHVRENGNLPAGFYGWWGSMGFERHIWDVLTRSFGGRVEVIFHPPVTAAEFPDRKRLADHCQHAVMEGMAAGLPKMEAVGIAPET